MLAFVEVMACPHVKATERCPSHEEAGWVSSVDVIDATRSLEGRPQPLIRRGSEPSATAELDALCVRDHVDNPDNSNRLITLHLISGDKILRPGEHFTIDSLTYSDWLNKNRDKFDTLLKSAFGPNSSFKRGHSRTGGCPLSPQQDPPTFISVVADWGPLFLTWPCNPPNSVPFVAFFYSDRAPIKAEILRDNFYLFDAAGLCKKACSVHILDGPLVDGPLERPHFVITPGQNEILFGFEIIVVKPTDAKVPEYLLRADTDDPWARTALGAYLLQGADLLPKDEQSKWKNQGLSLLVTEACRKRVRVPVAARLTARTLGTSDLTLVCK